MGFINLPILIFSFVLVFGILTSLFSAKANVPLILVFLCIGLLSGDNGLGLIQGFVHPKVAFFVGSLALALILLDSGYQTRFENVKKNLTPSVLLATVGVLFTALFLTPAAYFVGGFSWTEAFLLTSVISSTDAAAVFFVLRLGGVSIREKIKSTLEMESGSNDPMAIFLTFSVLMLCTKQITSPWFLTLDFVMQMGIGILFGFLLGFIIRWTINKIDIDTGLYPILLIGMALIGFSVTNLLGGSGFLALYIAGMILGVAHLKGKYQILRFQTTLTWLCQSVLFLTLGFFADIKELPDVAKTAFVLSVVLTFIARPLAVFVCLLPFGRYSFWEKLFISFVGLRGATSILLALAPFIMGIPAAGKMFSIVFLMVLLSLSMQGLIIIPMSKWCKVALPILEKPAEKSQIDLPGLVDSCLISYKLTENTPAVLGMKIPKWAMPVYVQRGDISYNGANIKAFKPNDVIYVFASDEKKAEMLDKFYGGGQSENLLQNMGDFVLSAEVKLKELAYLYNVKVPKKWEENTLRETLEGNFSDLEIGDRFVFGQIEIVIRQKQAGKIVEVGLNLEPQKKVHSLTRLLQYKKKKS